MSVVAQVFMIIATLSTNIAANVIAPSNAFSNLWPKKISFKTGGTITGIVGISNYALVAMLNEISGFLIFVSGLLGPVLGILIADYYLVRKKKLELAELYKEEGIYSYNKTGFNTAAMIALSVGVFAGTYRLLGSCIEFLIFLILVYRILYFVCIVLSINEEKIKCLY